MTRKSSIQFIRGGVTAPKGYLAAGVTAGIKYSGRKDLALIFSAPSAKAAAVYTTNVVKAAPVLVNMKRTPSNSVRAILANSGCANACTGTGGVRDALSTANFTAKKLGIREKQVLVFSTGAIGPRLPMAKVQKGILEAVLRLSRSGSAAAALAIKTTDIQTKETAVEISIQGKKVRMGAIAKGSGMIDPTMATMLAFITTDATAPISYLQKTLRQAVAYSFNRITVDNEQSTNDSALLLANGASGAPSIRPGTYGAKIFQNALTEVCVRLAKMIARDGEGATKLMEVRVMGARSESDAARIAKRVAGSLLVKAAVHGGDPNMGRIIAAVGTVGIPVRPDRIDVAVGNVPMARGGRLLLSNEKRAGKEMKKDSITFTIRLGMGRAAATAWGCDLSAEYVRINADYRT